MAEDLTGHYLPEQTYYAIGTQTSDDVAAATDGRGAALVTTAGTYHEVMLDPSSSFNHSQESIEVQVASAHGAGELGVPGVFTYDCNFEVVLRGCDVQDANSRPTIAAILGMFFNTPTYDAGPPKTLTFASASFNHTPITVKKYVRGKGNDGAVTTYFGGLGNPTFKFEKNGLVKLSSSFVPLGHTGPVPINDSAVIDTLDYLDTEGDRRLPIVNRNVSDYLSQWISGGVTYAGHVIEGEISLNFTTERIEAAGGLVNSGVKVISGTNQAGTASLRVIQDSLTVFDPHALAAANEPFAVTIGWIPVDGGVVAISYHAQITKISESMEGKIAAWDLELRLVHTASAGTYDAGEIPNEGRLQLVLSETT